MSEKVQRWVNIALDSQSKQGAAYCEEVCIL